MRHDSGSVRLVALAGLLGALTGATAGAGEGKNWAAEVGTSVAHTDNFFFRATEGGVPPPSATIATLYANGEVVLKSGGGKWTLGGGASGNYTEDIPDANYATARFGVEYKRHRTRGSLELDYLPNRVYSEEGDGVFFDLGAVTLGMRQVLGPGWWVGVEYGVETWRFDPIESARDALSDDLRATLRFPVSRRAGFRAFGLGMRKDAVSSEYDWKGYGYGMAFEWQASERVSLFARARKRERDYDAAPQGDSNFERSDSIVDALINLRWQAGRVWGLGLAGKVRDSESTRPDRNYDASELGFTVFFVI